MNFSIIFSLIVVTFFAQLSVHCMDSMKNETLGENQFSKDREVIRNYLALYSNPDLEDKMEECVRSVSKDYFGKIVRDYPNILTLEHLIQRNIYSSRDVQIILEETEDLYLGCGGYAFVLKNAQYDIAFKVSFPGDWSYDPIVESEMPTEYCFGLLSPTPYILKPLGDSFVPIKFPDVLFNTSFEVKGDTFHFNEATELQIHNVTFAPKVVPMYAMPLCQKINWKNLGVEIRNEYLFKMLIAIDEIHKSGIALVDISPGNIMLCNGEVKFIDLGFARLYSNISKFFNPHGVKFFFGNEFYRSPWAQIVSSIPKEEYVRTNWALDEKLILELIAIDFWSLAMIFLYSYCGVNKNKNMILLKNNIRSTINARFIPSYSVNEVNRMLQKSINDIFHEIGEQFSYFCPKSFQDILKSILQVDPIVRMQNVEKVLYIAKSEFDETVMIK